MPRAAFNLVFILFHNVNRAHRGCYACRGTSSPGQRQLSVTLQKVFVLGISLELTKLVVHKPISERGVVNDELCAFNVVQKFVRHPPRRSVYQQETHQQYRTPNASGSTTIGFEIDVEVVPRQTTVHHFNSTDLNDLVPFVVRADLVHTGGFGIRNNLASNCSAHRVIYNQTYRLTERFKYRSLPEMRKQVNFPWILSLQWPGGYGAIMRYRQHEKLLVKGIS